MVPPLDTGHLAPGVDDLLARPMVLVAALAVLSLGPMALMTLTAFLKIETVLRIVRGAIGAPGVPSTTVVMALAGALTLLAMAPVGERVAKRAAPLFSGHATADTVAFIEQGIGAVVEPTRDFLRSNASDQEKARFLDVARRALPEAERAQLTDGDLSVLIPAFMVTELNEAFALGFLLYLPFVIIDMVVSNVLLALGMQMMTPTQVSLPFKLLLFVAIDGWGLLARGLVAGYAHG